MDKEEIRNKFAKNVEYLRRNVPPDDIYLFTEQTYMASLYFLHKWSELVNLKEECEKDPVAKKWVTNIIGLLMCRDADVDLEIDLDLESIEGE